MAIYTQQPKKMLIINILDILKRYTDEDHRLSQKDIVEILKKEYSMASDRKSVRRNILNLIDFGYNIEYSESVRMVPNSVTGELEESYMMSDFYLIRDFDDSELRLLIDGLLFSKHIPYSQCKALVEKLEGLSNQYFRSRVRYIRTLPENAANNKQLFLNIDLLDEAIAKGRKVAFQYTEYGTDKKLHPRCNEDGKVREYVASPYQMAASNGRYYLICNLENYDNVANYRLDRIQNLRILELNAKPMKQVEGIKNGLNLPKHMAEHVYMFSGESAPVQFTFKRYIINDVMDWFGSDVRFVNETEEEITAVTHVNLRAMRRWALQYAMHAKIQSPASLRKEVEEDLRKAMENYQN